MTIFRSEVSMSKASQRRLSNMRKIAYKPPVIAGAVFKRRQFFTLIKLAFTVLIKGEARVNIKEHRGKNAKAD